MKNIITRKKGHESNVATLYSNSGREFEMNISAKSTSRIINLLTDLYTNPLEATIRELLSNAIDANKRANSSRPIEVTLPTQESKTFAIRDYGGGMSLETLTRIYSQYGESTKTTDMTQVGAFGLGAKAPLSYTNQFIVSSIKDGVNTTVILQRKSDRNVMTIISEVKTNEPSGVKVMVEINKDDIKKATTVIKIIAECATDFDIKVTNQLDEVKKLKLIGEINVGEDEKGRPINLRVFTKKTLDREIQDTVPFSIYSKPAFILSGWPYNFSSKRNYFNQSVTTDYLIELQPGLVDFSSSRDEITVNSRSRSLFEKVNSQLSDLVKKHIHNEVAKMSDRELNAVINQLPSRYPVYTKSIAAIYGDRDVNGKTMKEIAESPSPMDIVLWSVLDKKSFFVIVNESIRAKSATDLKKYMNDGHTETGSNLFVHDPIRTIVCNIPADDGYKAIRAYRSAVRKAQKDKELLSRLMSSEGPIGFSKKSEQELRNEYPSLFDSALFVDFNELEKLKYDKNKGVHRSTRTPG